MTEIPQDFERWFNENYADERNVAAEQDMYVPTTSRILAELNNSGESLTGNYGRLIVILDRIAPVIGTYTIVRTPKGNAPEAIREHWIGVSLPVRAFFESNKGIPVLAREAIELVSYKSPTAYEWWKAYYRKKAQINRQYVQAAAGFPEFMANISYMYFDSVCGVPALIY